MNGPLDPYYLWLGIPPQEQPPHHYRLLGIALFEDNPDVISMAAQRQMAHVKQLARGPHVDLSQQLLNELAAARLCLLDRERKAGYDARLRSQGKRPGPLAPEAAIPEAATPEGATGGDVAQPAPRVEHQNANSERQWLIGSGDACDVVIRETTVSKQHCRLFVSGREFGIEDLRSTNGTFVNGRRVTAATPLAATDRVRLGQRVPLDWLRFARNVRSIHVGSAKDNDVVLDHPTISRYHAVLLISARGMQVQDKRSTNGLAVGKVENKVRTARVEPATRLFFGSQQVTVSELLAAADGRPDSSRGR